MRKFALIAALVLSTTASAADTFEAGVEARLKECQMTLRQLKNTSQAQLDKIDQCLDRLSGPMIQAEEAEQARLSQMTKDELTHLIVKLKVLAVMTETPPSIITAFEKEMD